MTENEFRDFIIDSELDSKSKFIAFLLLHYRNRKTGKCYPSQQTLSSASGYCTNAIKSATQNLEDAGFLKVTRARLKGNKFTNIFYVFSFDPSPDEVSNEPSNEVSNDIAPDAYKPIEPIKPKKPSKKEKVIKKKTNLPDFIDKDLWNDFIDMRKGLKKNPTELAIELLIKKLTKFNDEGQDTSKILENSIMNSYLGLFAIKELNQKGDSNAKSNGLTEMERATEQMRINREARYGTRA